MQYLEGKTVLITGGARRLGRAIALAMSRAGAQVAITYLESGPAANELISAIQSNGRKSVAIHCDVRDEKSVVNASGKVVDQFGGLDILVNNAAVFHSVAFDELTAEHWDNVFAINARGTFLMSKACAPAMRANGGRIINMGSLGGEHPWSTHAHYCASKAAVHMLTKVLAKALAPQVAVNCVAPGMIESGERERDSATLQRFAGKTPVGRNGTPEDIVSAVMYFATAPSFITGQIMFVDGGLGLK